MAKDTKEPIVTDEKECDLSRATYTATVSSIGVDEGKHFFWATMDKVLFKHPVEVITTVLQANGYVVNLENLLGCLEKMTFAIRTKPTNKLNKKQQPVVRNFNFCVHFPLPEKKRVGELLKLFYEEIEAYESALATLQGKSLSKGGSKKELTVAELREENAALHGENEALKAELKAMANKLAELKHRNEHASATIESQNLLPDKMRIAKVRAINVEERHVALKSAGTTFHVPLATLPTVPEVGTKCLVHVEAGMVKGAFFYEKAGIPYKIRLGEVLHVKQDVCKLRDDSRRTWILRARNDFEQEQIRKLRRETKLLLYLFKNTIVRFEECQWSNTAIHEQLVEEAITTQEITKPSNRRTA